MSLTVTEPAPQFPVALFAPPDVEGMIKDVIPPGYLLGEFSRPLPGGAGVLSRFYGPPPGRDTPHNYAILCPNAPAVQAQLKKMFGWNVFTPYQMSDGNELLTITGSNLLWLAAVPGASDAARQTLSEHLLELMPSAPAAIEAPPVRKSLPAPSGPQL